MITLPGVNKTVLLRLIQHLNHFLPIIARGLALGLGIVAIATIAFEMGEYSGTRARYFMAGIYLLLALASFAVSRAVKPMLKWLLRRI